MGTYISISICMYERMARLAQTVERWPLKPMVAGSIPAVGVSYMFYIYNKIICVDSSMVRIRAFQARGPGSIPGRRILVCMCIYGPVV